MYEPELDHGDVRGPSLSSPARESWIMTLAERYQMEVV